MAEIRAEVLAITGFVDFNDDEIRALVGVLNGARCPRIILGMMVDEAKEAGFSHENWSVLRLAHQIMEEQGKTRLKEGELRALERKLQNK